MTDDSTVLDLTRSLAVASAADAAGVDRGDAMRLVREIERRDRAIDLSGKHFGQLTVIQRAGVDRQRGATWLVRCACGREVVTRSRSLIHGDARSCGCRVGGQPRHGMYQSAEYRAWAHMVDRCRNPQCRYYAGYGERGIRVCAEWEANFEVFFAHIGPRPSSKHSLDRVDNDGNYEPGNVRWATQHEQTRNTRQNRLVTLDGRTMCLRDWARERGIPFSTAHGRLRRGWDVARALAPRRSQP